jgi:hypothetical protein
VEAVALFCRVLVPLGQFAREAVDFLENLVHLSGRETVGESCPCAMHDGLVHGQSGGVTHSLVEPEDVPSRVEIKVSTVGHVVGASFLCDAGLEILIGSGRLTIAIESCFRWGMDEGLYIDVE